jgi:amidohydrolase
MRSLLSNSDDVLASLLPRMIELRHDLHRHPELGFEERRTQRVVLDELTKLGLEPRVCAKTGVLCDLRPDLVGRGETFALRADLDALPMQEHTELPWRSVHDGRAHKCGHDGHTTILLTTASLLAARRQTLRRNVRLVFQPAEEGVDGGGAKPMIDEGAVDDVAWMFGLHNWPAFPKGEVRVVAGPTMAAVHTFRLRLHGRGGHASAPDLCRDPIVAGAALVGALQTIVSRELGHRGGAVVSIGRFVAGEANNVIPDHALLEGTIRSFGREVTARVLERFHAIVDGIAAAYAVRAELELLDTYPTLVNDPRCAALVEDVARSIVGEDKVHGGGLPLAASEDFAYFAEAVPSAYFFLGAGQPGDDTPGCHHPDFDFDDDLIALGARMFVGLVERVDG